MKTICPNCLSDKMQGKAWVELNDETEVDFSPLESGDVEDYWCPECEEHVLPILENEINKQND